MGTELPEIQLTTFNLGDNLYAVDIMRVREILLPQDVYPLPRASNVLEGVINLRGAVIPLMDMRKQFGMPPLFPENSGKLMIVFLARQMLAIAVDEIMGVISVPAAGITPPPDIADGIGAELLLGICLHENQVYMIIDLDSLIAPGDYLYTDMSPGY